MDAEFRSAGLRQAACMLDGTAAGSAGGAAHQVRYPVGNTDALHLAYVEPGKTPGRRTGVRGESGLSPAWGRVWRHVGPAGRRFSCGTMISCSTRVGRSPKCRIRSARAAASVRSCVTSSAAVDRPARRARYQFPGSARPSPDRARRTVRPAERFPGTTAKARAIATSPRHAERQGCWNALLKGKGVQRLQQDIGKVGIFGLLCQQQVLPHGAPGQARLLENRADTWHRGAVPVERPAKIGVRRQQFAAASFYRIPTDRPARLFRAPRRYRSGPAPAMRRDR